MKEETGRAKYSIVYENIKNDIITRRIKPGEKIPSEYELIEQNGVSRHTIRKALAMLKNNGYIETEHGRGSFCSDRYSKHKRSHNIVVVTTYISDYIFPNLIAGIDSVLEEQGYSIILKSTGNSQENEKRILEDMLTKEIDGLIIEPSKSAIYCMHEEQYQAFDQWKIPYVFIQGIYPQMEEKPHIMLDDIKGSYLATKYLIDLGHEHIVGIFKADDIQGVNRYKGYIKALNEAGIEITLEQVIWFHTEDREVKPAAMIKEWIKQKRKLDGIICYNDEIAWQIYQTLQTCGKRVPEDISITGYDYSGLSTNGPIRFTTVSHPKEKLGEMAAKLLLEKIRGISEESLDIPQRIEPELVIGDSCMVRKK